MIQPLLPSGSPRQPVQQIDQRKSKASQLPELIELPGQIMPARIVINLKGFQAQLEFVLQALQSTLPTIAAADYGCIHQQLFPAGGGAWNEGFVRLAGRGIR